MSSFLTNLYFEYLQKARKSAPVGTKKQFAGKWYVKTEKGWRPVPKGMHEGATLEEHRERAKGEKQEKIDKVIKMAQEGKSTSEIQKETGYSAARIIQHVVNARKSGVEIGRRKRIGKEKVDVYKAYDFEGAEFGDPERRNLRASIEGTHPARDSTGKFTKEGREKSESAIEKGYYQYGEQRIQVTRSGLTQAPSLNYIPSALGESLRAHQSDYINLAMEGFEQGKPCSMNFDSAGTGKTRQEIGLAATYLVHHGGKVLLITENDRIMAGGMAGDAKAMQVKMNPVKKLADLDKGDGIYVTTYKDLAKFKDRFGEFGLVISDEAHNMKNSSTSAKAKNGLELLSKAKNSALFSATPVDKAAHLEYICQAQKLNFPEVMKTLGFYRDANAGGWGTNLEALETARRIDSFFAAFTKDGTCVKREIPLKGLELEMKTVPLDAHHQSKYDAAYEKMTKELEVSEPRERGLLKAKWLMRIRSMLEEAKLDHAVKSIEAEIKSGRQVVFFATSVNDRVSTGDAQDLSISEDTFNNAKELIQQSGGKLGKNDISSLAGFYNVPLQTIQAIAEGKDYDTVSDLTENLDPAEVKSKLTTGSLVEMQKRLKHRGIDFASVFNSNKEAVQQIKDFQSGKLKCIITSPQSGGTGISLDDTVGNAPRTLIMTTPPFSAVDYIQMLGRVHRLNTKSKSKAMLLSTDTHVEQWNKGIISSKLAKLGAAVKGDYEALSVEDLEAAENLAPEEAQKFLAEKKEKVGAMAASGPAYAFDLNHFRMTDEQIAAKKADKAARLARRRALKASKGELGKSLRFLSNRSFTVLSPSEILKRRN